MLLAARLSACLLHPPRLPSGAARRYDLRDWARRAPEAGVHSQVLFSRDALHCVLVTVPPGGEVPLHRHAHAEEVFDVVEGEGEFWIDGAWQRVCPGTLVVIEAGAEHGLRNPTDRTWVLRETVSEHVYARRALRNAVAKRFGRGSRRKEAP